MIANRIQRLSEILHFDFELGRQATTVDADKTYVYDAFGAITNETVVGVAGTNVLERFHDAFGRDAGYALNGVRRTTLAYDSATGRIASMGVGEGRVPSRPPAPFRWTYLPGSDLKESLAYPNGDVVRWEYEPNRDLVTLVSNGVHSSFRYAYDAAGRRIAKNDERYRYNPRGELVLSTNVVTGAEFAYRYDDIGNRLWSREFGTNCTYAANELNQYTSIVRGRVAEFPAFDLDGNQTNIVTSTGEWSVGYNGENRPIRWTRNADGLVVTMSYDRMGRRVTKGGERFVYDNYLNVGQTIWDPTEPVATRPLVWLGEDGSAYFFHDGNKNVVDFVPTGVISSACHYTYTPFGTDTGSAGDTDINPWRFSSEYADRTMGLVYYNYRHYDHVVGRWSMYDPVDELMILDGHFNEQLGQNVGVKNSYAIAMNDLLNGYDILGLYCGSGWSENVVSDVIDGFDFSNACKNHDDCYGTCHKGNDVGKMVCDNAFLSDMLSVCLGHLGETRTCWRTMMCGIVPCSRPYPCDARKKCDEIASTYYWAVDHLGGKAYNNAQKESCDPCVSTNE